MQQLCGTPHSLHTSCHNQRASSTRRLPTHLATPPTTMSVASWDLQAAHGTVKICFIARNHLADIGDGRVDLNADQWSPPSVPYSNQQSQNDSIHSKNQNKQKTPGEFNLVKSSSKIEFYTHLDWNQRLRWQSQPETVGLPAGNLHTGSSGGDDWVMGGWLVMSG
eukprot:NODE_2410_length_703_cov_70.435780_g1961_i0.p1 GENE.NODE_2410_length_703_cov_70.435780_g1961_i0~~NODE_2410_length_703_cov_70.435780_g1961_i0.p1  ORF type:complete len:165 (-),score=16.37 NODE_2410_length_703_cov_70.435780_g1961_i0:154-648(-)